MSDSAEYERRIGDDALRLTGTIYGLCPVQAPGTIAGCEFYFRARWDSWSFSVSTDPDVSAVDIQRPEQGFLREGDYGKSGECEASAMPYDEAERFIRNAAAEFLREHPPSVDTGGTEPAKVRGVRAMEGE